MLNLTDNAQTLVRDLTDRPEVPDGAGLRIAPAPSPGQLQVSIAAAPEDGDEVIDSGGARVFVEPQTAELLGDSTLDAQQGADGPSFVLTQDQPPA
ncbi:MAG: HesB/IscA family protein [Actinomycetota bacterium]